MSKTNQDQIHLSNFFENASFHYKRGKGNLFSYMINRIKWHFYPKLNYIAKYPEHVDVELSSACNMRCPMCYTITDEYKSSVKRTNMEPEMIEKIMKECGEGGVYSVRLSWRGELTLNPKWIDAIKIAKKYGVKEVSTLTNALLLTPEKFEQMLDAGLDWLTISVDGVGAEYEKIRAPAKFPEFLEKLKQFQEIKKRRNSVKPVIKVQTIWPAIEDNPQEYYDTYSPLVDQVTCNQLVDYLAEDDVNTIEYADGFDCHVLYQRLTIGADGKVLMCYNDEFDNHAFGDLNSDLTIKEVWEGKQMNEARSVHKKNLGMKTYKACSKCFLPREHESFKTVKVDGREISIDTLTGRSQDVSVSIKYK